MKDGYQPRKISVNPNNPPQGGSGVPRKGDFHPREMNYTGSMGQKDFRRDKEMLRQIDTLNYEMKRLKGEVLSIKNATSKEEEFFGRLIEKGSPISIMIGGEHESFNGKILSNFRYCILIKTKEGEYLVQKSSIRYLKLDS